MIECPYCGVYWDYIKDLDYPWNRNIIYIRSYKLKEQSECTEHVARDHSTILLIEQLNNEIQDLRTIVNEKL